MIHESSLLKNRLKSLILLVFVFCFLQFLYCDKDELIFPVTISLVISPNELILEDNEPTGTVYLSTQPEGELNWQIASKPDWIELTPSQGRISGKIQEITVSANAENFELGTYSGKVELISDVGGAGEFNIYLNVKVHPEAAISLDSLNFSDSIENLNFSLINIGTGYLQWSLDISETWLSAYPRYGTLSSQDSAKINVSVDRKGMAVGSYAAKIIIKSNSETGDKELPVSMTVSEIPNLDLSTNTLTFNYFVDTLNFSILNTGNSPFDWNAHVSESFIQIDPHSGTISQGDSSKVHVYALRDALISGIYTAVIEVTNNVSQSESLMVTINHYEEEKWILDHRVVDSEYDRNNDVIITVSAEPSKLFVLKPENQVSQSIDLPLTPNCISVRPDGEYAAVGHDGYVTYVNLSTISIEKTYAVTTDAIDIVLPSNGWVYVFPRTDQWESIRCIDLSTGAETTSGGYSIRAGTLAKLHPSGDYIYGADNGLSPSDFEKYDIRNGTATVMYDSPYHGDYSFGGNIWISDDGQRLFARSGNVFRASTVRSEDMTYNGNLAGLSNIVWLDYSSDANRIYAVGGGGYWDPPEPEIRVYETNYLAFKGTIPLPGFLVPENGGAGKFYQSEGQFVFVNSTGTKIITLVKAEETSGLLLDWAVVTFDVASTP